MVRAIHLQRFGDAPAASPSLLIIADSEPQLSTVEAWIESFGKEFVLYTVVATLPKPTEVESFSVRLAQCLQEENVRRATVFGVGTGAVVAMALAVQASRSIRRLVLLDASSRIIPSTVERIIDRLESRLPLGLPFRPISESFDARPILHLIRCPTLVLQAPLASFYLQEQAALLQSRIPNCWSYTLKASTSMSEPSTELTNAIRHFLQTPVKRPQKNRA